MAPEPQSVLPIPLRLQPDFQRLMAEVRALKSRIRSGEKSDIEAWQAKSRELIDYIISYKQSL